MYEMNSSAYTRLWSMNQFRIFHIIPKETDSLLLSLMVFVHLGYGL
jgi:hypothetical protein